MPQKLQSFQREKIEHEHKCRTQLALEQKHTTYFIFVAEATDNVPGENFVSGGAILDVEIF